MDLLEELDSELNALRAVLGDEYADLRTGEVHATHGPSKGVDDDCSDSDTDDAEQGNNNGDDQNDERDQTGPLDAGCTSDTLLQHVDAALETNSALSSKLQRIIEHVQRRIRENDATLSAIKAAQSVDRNLGRPAASLQFSWQMRHSTTSAQQRASTSRFLSSTGEPAPPLSTFWSRGGVAPAPNDDACALARLFWRNPASARPPAPWTPAEKLHLRDAIRSQVVAQRQSQITADFQRRVKSGEPADILKPQLLASLAALKEVRADDTATLRQADAFSRTDWQAVSQQLQDRPADDCKVHFHAHMHPRYSRDLQRSLTEEEQTALLAAVDLRGCRSWDRVAADTGLRWPPWRVLQCYHAALRNATAADDATAWDAALDDKLIKAAMELTGMSNNDRRRVSWLRVAHSVGSGVSAEACQQRFCHLQNTHALRGTFSPQESAALREAVQEHGDRWSKVAEHVPGRTPRQCAEHYIFLASRNVRDMSAVWRRGVEMRLLEARAKHCPGMRAPDWEAVARDMSEMVGVQLTVEDCKRKSKLLIRRLHHSGLPERATVDAQWRYALQNPDALATAQDARRRELQRWAAERGLSMRPHVPHAEAATAAAVAAPAAPGEAPEILRQSRYLRALAGLSATPGGLEVRGDAPTAVPAHPDSDAVVTGNGVDTTEGGGCGTGAGDGAGSVDVDAQVHPIAAAMVNMIRARHVRGDGGAQQGASVEATQHAGQADVSSVSVLGVGAVAAEEAAVSLPAQGDTDGSSAWALKVHGAMSEGRRLEDVRTCAERRRVRIRTLAQQGRLQVRLCMPQWRQKLADAAAQPRPCTRKAKQRRKGCAGQLLPQGDGERAVLSTDRDSLTTGGMLEAARAALEELAAPIKNARMACVGQGSTRKRPQGRPPACTTSKSLLPRTTSDGEAVNGSGAARDMRVEGEEGAAAGTQPRSAGGHTSQPKVPPPPRYPFAPDLEALAARARARESPGGRRSGRKRKLTSKVDPDNRFG